MHIFLNLCLYVLYPGQKLLPSVTIPGSPGLRSSGRLIFFLTWDGEQQKGKMHDSISFASIRHGQFVQTIWSKIVFFIWVSQSWAQVRRIYSLSRDNHAGLKKTVQCFVLVILERQTVITMPQIDKVSISLHDLHIYWPHRLVHYSPQQFVHSFISGLLFAQRLECLVWDT